jgi:D-alanyl-D-alanine carboxypeptidase (penicillin-binding protein 5/6)
VPAFAAMMNRDVRALGLTRMHFVEPSGLSSQNKITALDYAKFCRHYIRRHPRDLASFHSVRKFVYNRNVFINHNRLLGRHSYSGITYNVDGLKTGFIHESGYNIALTARSVKPKGAKKFHSRRFIVVLLGVPASLGRKAGERARDADGLALLNEAFTRRWN